MPFLILFDNNDQIILTKDNKFIDVGNQDFVASLSELNAEIFDYLQSITLEINNAFAVSDIITNVTVLKENLLISSDYYAAILPNVLLDAINSEQLSEIFQVSTIRSLLLNSNIDTITVISKARQLAYWNADHRFCGKCSAQTIRSKHEYARQCIACKHVVYPRITPCILAAVVNQDKILLGRSVHFPPGVYSLLAGFVEVGETCEQTVAREVYEEAGVTVGNIQYFASQPWPFPHSIMLAYTADYISGKIIVAKTELEDARWFTFESLRTAPDLLPSKLGLSRMLLDHLINKHTMVR